MFGLSYDVGLLGALLRMIRVLLFGMEDVPGDY